MTLHLATRSRSDAADIRGLITTPPGLILPGAPAAPQGLSPVVVELLQDIAGDDPRQYDAALMRIDGDQWVDTMQNVRIRNVTRHQLRQGERRIARPTAGLGLCVQGRFPVSGASSSGTPDDWITLKAFDSNGAFLYEYKIAHAWETHNGLLYATEVRPVSGVPWSRWFYSELSLGFGTTTLEQPEKTGIHPIDEAEPPVRVWAFDLVRIDRATGAKTLLHADIDYVMAPHTPDTSNPAVDPWGYTGIPEIAPKTDIRPQSYYATSDGLIVGSPLNYPDARIRIYWYDHWLQQTISRFRILAVCAKDGGSADWAFYNGASSASFAWDATAATIKTALESITGVVSATVTGGPLPYYHVDIAVTWTTTTGRFTLIEITNLENHNGDSLYDLSAGGFAGRTEIGAIPTNIVLQWTSDDAGTVFGNAERYDLTSDAAGLLFDATAVWSGTKLTIGTVSCAGASTSIGVERIKHGKVLVSGRRRTSAGTGRTFAVVDEATGTLEGEGDTFLDGTQVTHLFLDSGTVGAWGPTDCPSGSGGVRMTGGDQFVALATTGGAAGDGLMIGETTLQGADADHVVTHGSVLTSRGTALSATGLARDVYSPHAITFVTGGDAFFPTKDYNKHLVNLYAENRYYNTDLEWRLTLGDPTGSPTFTSSWFPYSETEANVMTEVDAWYGNNSASLPVIQLAFATPADNADTPIPWYARGPQFLITGAAIPSDTPTHGLMPNHFRFQIELRNGTRRLQRAIGKIAHADSSIVWQRDIGPAATHFRPGTARVEWEPTVTYDHSVIVWHSWAPRRAQYHPPLISGPLP